MSSDTVMRPKSMDTRSSCPDAPVTRRSVESTAISLAVLTKVVVPACGGPITTIFSDSMSCLHRLPKVLDDGDDPLREHAVDVGVAPQDMLAGAVRHRAVERTRQGRFGAGDGRHLIAEPTVELTHHRVRVARGAAQTPAAVHRQC